MAGRFTRSAAVALAVLLAGTATTPAAADPAISCSYRLTSWTGGFSADLTIANHGPAISGWTVRMTFPGPATLLGAWRAVMTQSTPFDMIATNLPSDNVLSPGQLQTFGWTASSTDTGMPTTVTVNGTAC